MQAISTDPANAFPGYRLQITKPLSNSIITYVTNMLIVLYS
ncbi:hypothetical protein LX66_1306 [Chitinophaga japonensis]|uniref:Uncharacterized protein n=1 Tax=Chitinophaga japonensis TaxID=104662 RepID=A0A562TEM3_CHIJA|nr:hypothetical protein LX66_1306 [Chitinophaga japonensis]